MICILFLILGIFVYIQKCRIFKNDDIGLFKNDWIQSTFSLLVTGPVCIRKKRAAAAWKKEPGGRLGRTTEFQF